MASANICDLPGVFLLNVDSAAGVCLFLFSLFGGSRKFLRFWPKLERALCDPDRSVSGKSSSLGSLSLAISSATSSLMSRAVLGLAAKLGAFPDRNVAGSMGDTEP